MRPTVWKAGIAAACCASVAIWPSAVRAPDSSPACALDLASLRAARALRIERAERAYSHGFEIAEALLPGAERTVLVKLNSAERLEDAGQCLWQPRLEASSADFCSGGRRFFSFGPAAAPAATATAMPETYCASCHRRYGDAEGVFWKRLKLELDRVPVQSIGEWMDRRTCPAQDRAP